MTEEQINIAIAEACGWQWNVQKADGRWWVMYPNGGGAGMTEKITAEYFFSVFSIPNYLNDLNAMHEAEKVLTDEQYRTFCESLLLDGAHQIIKGKSPENETREEMHDRISTKMDRDYLSASATRRAKHFLIAIGKWKETP